MASVATLLDRDRLDATIAWLSMVILAVAVVPFTWRGEPDWAVLAGLLAATALVVPVAERDPLVTVPGELLGLVTVPVVARVAGIGPTVTPFLAVGGLALLAAVALDAFTSLSMTPRFALVFVVVTTMAFAGAWAVGSFAADAVLGTAFLTNQTELMWDLVAATGAGVFAGVVFDLYFRFADRIERLGGGAANAADRSERAIDHPESEARYGTVIRAMQAVLAGIGAVAIARGDAALLVNSLGPLAITSLPAAFRREYDYAMDAGLVLWITLAATLHALGAVGLYGTFGWYDSLTHALSGSLVAGMGYAVARAVEEHSTAVTFNREFRVAFTPLFVLAVGVGWELLEFASGGLSTVVGGEAVLAQYGVADVVNDLVFNTLGAVVVAGYSSGHFEGVADRLAGGIDAVDSGE